MVKPRVISESVQTLRVGYFTAQPLSNSYHEGATPTIQNHCSVAVYLNALNLALEEENTLEGCLKFWNRGVKLTEQKSYIALARAASLSMPFISFCQPISIPSWKSKNLIGPEQH